MVTTTAIIILAACGVGLAVLYTYFIKKALGGFLRALSAKGAVSKESALTLSALGYGGLYAKIIYAFLGESSTLRRFVGASCEEGGISAQKYYLIPEKSKDALKRYDDKGASALSLLICAVALLIAVIVFIIAAPYVESYIDGIPDSFKDDKTEIKGTVDDGIEMITPEEIEKRYEEELKKQQEEAAKNGESAETEANGDNTGNVSDNSDKETDKKGEENK